MVLYELTLVLYELIIVLYELTMVLYELTMVLYELTMVLFVVDFNKMCQHWKADSWFWLKGFEVDVNIYQVKYSKFSFIRSSHWKITSFIRSNKLVTL